MPRSKGKKVLGVYMFTSRQKKGTLDKRFCQLPIFTTRWQNYPKASWELVSL